MINKYKKIYNNKIMSFIGIVFFIIENTHAADLCLEQTNEITKKFLSFDRALVKQAREVLHKENGERARFIESLVTKKSKNILETANIFFHQIPEAVFAFPHEKHTIMLNELEWTVNFLKAPSIIITSEIFQAASVICISTQYSSTSTEIVRYDEFFTLDIDDSLTLLISHLEYNTSFLNAPSNLKGIKLPTITAGDVKNAFFKNMNNHINKDGVVWDIIRSETTSIGEINIFIHQQFTEKTPDLNSGYNLLWANTSNELKANTNEFNHEFIFPLYIFNYEENKWKIYAKYEFLIQDSMNYTIRVPFNISHTFPSH